ncbi:MAG TPA: glycosyltransferase family 4 protein [Verrucomicrobiae bacterium]|nr:glycosyltransferase family 4 protein [Verrucomicrobiae bacterium]
MKLLVFAHTPPPFHGQSYMVKLMIDGFGGDHRKKRDSAPNPFGIECYHVNARFSKTLEDIGEFHGGKLWKIFFYCAQAIWCRFRYGVENLYYVPAPGKRVALYRDWLVMLLCRPFFKRIVLHWHAAGLGKWLETCAQIRSRSLTYRLLKPVDLSIVLSKYNFADAEKLLSQQIRIVAVGIPDPCPQFEEKVLPQRRVRSENRKKILNGSDQLPAGEIENINVLFVALCTREKGVFEAVEGVDLANKKFAARKIPLRFRIKLIGAFASETEERELRDLVARRNLQHVVEILGFVSAETKEKALANADIFCFPTYYLAENQPANLIEAMAYGLPLLTTRWRSIPEMLPENYPGLVEPKSSEQVAAALTELATKEFFVPLRENFLRRFTLEQHLRNLADAIHLVAPSE